MANRLIEHYNIVRHFKTSRKRIIKRGVLLAEAKAHCNDPETSSATCKGSVGVTRTRIKGPWFDSFEAIYGPALLEARNKEPYIFYMEL